MHNENKKPFLNKLCLFYFIINSNFKFMIFNIQIIILLTNMNK